MPIHHHVFPEEIKIKKKTKNRLFIKSSKVFFCIFLSHFQNIIFMKLLQGISNSLLLKSWKFQQYLKQCVFTKIASEISLEIPSRASSDFFSNFSRNSFRYFFRNNLINFLRNTFRSVFESFL